MGNGSKMGWGMRNGEWKIGIRQGMGNEGWNGVGDGVRFYTSLVLQVH